MCMARMLKGGAVGQMISRARDKRKDNPKNLGANDNQRELGRNRALGGGEPNQVGGGNTLLGGFASGMSGGRRVGGLNSPSQGMPRNGRYTSINDRLQILDYK